MGRTRSDWYNFNESSRPGPRTSFSDDAPHAPGTSKASTRASKPAGAGKGRNGRAQRVSRNRRAQETGCNNPQSRKGFASIIFMMGIPCAIAGLILTIVASTDSGEDGKKYPASFTVVGPVLLSLSVVFFLVGVLLYNTTILKAVRDCFNLSDKDSFCRVHFPRLSAFLKTDTSAAVNQAAINNLKIVPARSAMRKMPNPDLVTVETEVISTRDPGGQGQEHRQSDLPQNAGDASLPPRPDSGGAHRLSQHGHHKHHHIHHHHHHPHHRAHLPPHRKRAVTFSEGDADDYVDEDEVEGRFLRASTSSEPDRFSLHSDLGAGVGATAGGEGTNGGHTPNSSLLSLRHCKIYPKDKEVFWTSTSADGGGNGNGDGRIGGSGSSSDSVGELAGGGHPAAIDPVFSVHDSDGDDLHHPVVPGARVAKFSLDNIDEERA